MAANQGNAAIWQANLAASQANIAALQAAEEAEKRKAKMNADERRRDHREATVDLCEGIIASACVKDVAHSDLMEFHSFPKLPIELRIKICKYFVNTYLSNGGRGQPRYMSWIPI